MNADDPAEIVRGRRRRGTVVEGRRVGIVKGWVKGDLGRRWPGSLGTGNRGRERESSGLGIPPMRVLAPRALKARVQLWWISPRGGLWRDDGYHGFRVPGGQRERETLVIPAERFSGIPRGGVAVWNDGRARFGGFLRSYSTLRHRDVVWPVVSLSHTQRRGWNVLGYLSMCSKRLTSAWASKWTLT